MTYHKTSTDNINHYKVWLQRVQVLHVHLLLQRQRLAKMF